MIVKVQFSEAPQVLAQDDDSITLRLTFSEKSPSGAHEAPLMFLTLADGYDLRDFSEKRGEKRVALRIGSLKGLVIRKQE